MTAPARCRNCHTPDPPLDGEFCNYVCRWRHARWQREPCEVTVIDANTGNAALYSHGYPATPEHRPTRLPKNQDVTP